MLHYLWIGSQSLVIPVMFLVGFLVGGIWAVIPAIFKVRFDANETIMTLA